MDPIEATPFLPSQIGRGPHEGFLSALILALTNAFVRSAQRVNGVLPKDGTEPMVAQLDFASFPVKPPTYLTSTLPTAADWEGGLIYVSNGSSGEKFRGSDGSSWVNLG